MGEEKLRDIIEQFNSSIHTVYTWKHTGISTDEIYICTNCIAVLHSPASMKNCPDCGKEF